MNKMTGGTFGRTASRREGEGDAMRDEKTAFEDMFPSAEVLAARLAEAYAERDALRAEVERLRKSVHTACGSCGTPTNPDILVCPQCHDGWIVGNGAEFLDRATEALRAEVERLRLDVGRLLVAYGSRDEFDGVDDAIKDAAEMRAENNRLRAFVASLRADGLDIDDPDTAPTWTGKIHAPDGRLLFDLATCAASGRSPKS